MQSLGKLTVSELFFEVPKNYSRAQDGNLRLFARSAERFEKPVDISKKGDQAASMAYASFGFEGFGV